MGTRSAREPADRRLQSEIGHLVTIRTRVSTLFGPRLARAAVIASGGSSRHHEYRTPSAAGYFDYFNGVDSAAQQHAPLVGPS